MHKNRQKGNRWEADSPTDLIGWKVESIVQEGEVGVFTLLVSTGDGRRTRTVYATVEAVPLYSIERLPKGGK